MTIHVMTQAMLDEVRQLREFEKANPVQWCLVMHDDAYEMLLEVRRRWKWIPVTRKRRPGACRIGRVS